MLEVKNLKKNYGKVLAADEVSFEINDNEICILLGPNGAGKSTVIKCTAGLLRYTGNITINNHPNKTNEAKKLFSYVPETPSLYDALTIKEHLEFIAKAYRIKDYEKDVENLLERFDLADKTDKLGKELSKGMQQKVSICCGVLTKPSVILFDEPMMGLDPKAIKELKILFLELKDQGCSVLISTHIIDSIKDIWDRVLIMNKGKIVSNIIRSEVADENEVEERFFAVTGGTE
ncbi:MAG: ABC transporter ATP-binding protein [Clostridiales bacterium]|nr:ABC transporter ATP-binding protein [Clostridiales bacterium]